MVGYQHLVDPKGMSAIGKESPEMNTIRLDLEEDVVVLLHQFNQPVQQTARELIVLELYRRGTISSGKAAELLSMARQEFIHHASSLGIPYFAMTEDEWETERRRSETL